MIWIEWGSGTTSQHPQANTLYFNSLQFWVVTSHLIILPGNKFYHSSVPFYQKEFIRRTRDWNTEYTAAVSDCHCYWNETFQARDTIRPSRPVGGSVVCLVSHYLDINHPDSQTPISLSWILIFLLISICLIASLNESLETSNKLLKF